MSEVRALLSRGRQMWVEMEALEAQLRLLGANLPSAQHYRRALEKRRTEAADDLMRLETQIATLPDARDRAVLRYYYGQGLSDAAIGEKLGLTDEWARKRRYAAVRRLERREMEQRGEGR